MITVLLLVHEKEELTRQASKDVTDSWSLLYQAPMMCDHSFGEKTICWADCLFIIEAASHDSFVGSVLIKLVPTEGRVKEKK